MVGYLIVVTVLSTVTFTIYAIDKRLAQSDRWRVSERKLHLLALFGGWPGALLAQKVVRHKTQKQRFRMVFWITVLVHLLCVATVIYAFARRSW